MIFTRVLLTSLFYPGKINLATCMEAPMAECHPARFTAFQGTRRIASGALADVVRVVMAALEQDGPDPVLTFDDATGRVVDLDLRGGLGEVLERLGTPGESRSNPSTPKGRGRPRLGVVAKEVTLLPRHWEWLNAQPGGASVALRKLVEEARRGNEDKEAIRHAREATYAFMSAMAGNEPGYEEALRALFNADGPGFERHSRAWPADVGAMARHLARPAFTPTVPSSGDRAQGKDEARHEERN